MSLQQPEFTPAMTANLREVMFEIWRGKTTIRANVSGVSGNYEGTNGRIPKVWREGGEDVDEVPSPPREGLGQA